MASPFPADVIIMNMNVGTHKRKVNGKKVEVSAKERKTCIQNILNGKKPTLVFVQEFKWVGLHRGTAFNKFNIPEYYKFVGNNESGFIYDERYLNCERLDLKYSVERSYSFSISPHKNKLDFELSRICLCKINSVGPPDFELLCVCWHGPKNEYDLPKKISHLLSLFKFLLIIKAECGNLPLLLGGDFNLNSENVNSVCTKMSNELLMLKPRTQGSIMLWVQSDDFDKVFRLSDPEKDTYEKRWRAFDHVVLTMKLQIATTVEDLKRSHRLYDDFNLKPIVENKYHFRCHLNMREMSKTEHYPSFQMMSASWHGADAEYSDETKIESLKSAITFLQREINKRCNPEPDMIDLNWEGVVRDSSTAENMHSGYNTLDSWIFSSDKTALDLEDIGLDLHNTITALIDEPSRLTPRQRHAPNARPVDIHLDIVNMVLSLQKMRYIVTGYLNVCSYLSANVLE